MNNLQYSIFNIELISEISQNVAKFIKMRKRQMLEVLP